MSLIEEYKTLITSIAKITPIPLIDLIYLPSLDMVLPSHKQNFIAMKLRDGTIGLCYVEISPKLTKNYYDLNPIDFINKNPSIFALNFGSENEIQNTLGLCAINAISQSIFKSFTIPLDITTDSLGLLDLTPQDTIGMVGFFQPLIPLLEQTNSKLIIIEKKEKLVQKNPKWEVTLDTTRLSECNKILCTATTILNHSIENVLKYCTHAEKVSIVGPTAGLIPDPLFKRGIDLLGGSVIINADRFFNLVQAGKPWGPTTEKYCIQKNSYKGIQYYLNPNRSK